MKSTMPYVKLDHRILLSSVWDLDDATRIVWIALLALKDKNGMVHGSINGLARMARVKLAECEKAIRILEAPDPYDSSGIMEGRRIIKQPEGGWLVVNSTKYRDAKDQEKARAYHTNYMRGYRARKREGGEGGGDVLLTNVKTSDQSKANQSKTLSEKGGDILATESALTKTPLQTSKYPPFEVFKQFCHYHVVNELGEEDTYNWPAYFDFFEGIGWRTANGEPIAKWKPYVRMGIRKGWHKDKEQPEPYVTVEMVKEYCTKKGWHIEDYAWGQLMGSKYYGKPITNRQDFRAAMEAIGSQWSRENR